MSWKKYKAEFTNSSPDETHFILGVDIGNSASCIAYYDIWRKEPETIDLSGGYGKPSSPTMLQYIPENREWIYGEYAANNRGIQNSVTLSSVVDRLGKTEYYEIDGRPVSCANVLGLFVKDLIGNCKNINPKAEIAGICVSIGSYMPDGARDELLSAFKYAGYEKSVISLVTDRDCALSLYSASRKSLRKENVLLLDFGGRELRGGVYELSPATDGKMSCVSLSSMFDETLGTANIDKKIDNLITGFYCESMKVPEIRLDRQTKDSLLAFSYQHKDLLFGRNIAVKPVKLYYNFVYPPFMKSVSYSDIAGLISPFERNLKEFVTKTLSNAVTKEGESLDLDVSSIDKVICAGGGFEMIWAREAVNKIFGNLKVLHFKNPKCVIAEGASVIAAANLGITDGSAVVTAQDPHQIACDIGVTVKSGTSKRFIPIAEKNSLWWQNHKPKTFIINEPTDKPVDIGLYRREQNGEATLIKTLTADGLPPRPKGVTKIEIRLEFESYNMIRATVKDLGFGELFPRSGFEKKFPVRL